MNITIYEDFQCPVCKVLEETQGASLRKLIANNQATVTYVPLALPNLDSGSGGYSTTGANAGYCAGSGGFRQLHDTLYADQPEEGDGEGLSNAEIISLAEKVDVTGAAFTSCVTSGTYNDFVRSQFAYLSNKFEQLGVNQWGTPAVFVNDRWASSDWQQAGYFESIVAQESRSASPRVTGSSQ